MATKPSSNEKVFDVSKAGSNSPVTGSKPVIVGHKSEVKDPMVKQDEPDIKPPSQTVRKLEPIVPPSQELDPKKEEPVKAEEKPESNSKEPEGEHDAQDAEIKKTEDTSKEDEDAERQQKLADLVKNKKYFVQVKAPARKMTQKLVLPLVLLFLLVGGYALVDAEIIKTNFALPFDFIKNSTESESSQQTTAPEPAVAQTAESETPAVVEEKTEPTKATPTKSITEVNIIMKKVGDETQLPDNTPATFVTYMKKKLTAFDCEVSTGGVIVKKISEKFLSGSVGCDGGYSAFWYMLDGNWQEFGTQDTPPCDDVTELGIPEEFIPVCIDIKTEQEKPNPNGSIDA